MPEPGPAHRAAGRGGGRSELCRSLGHPLPGTGSSSAERNRSGGEGVLEGRLRAPETEEPRPCLVLRLRWRSAIPAERQGLSNGKGWRENRRGML